MYLNPLVIPIVGMMIPIVIVPTSLWFRHRLRVREMEHIERIRSLELGIAPPPPGINWPGATLCLGLGAGVPVGTMLVAWGAVALNDVSIEVFGIALVTSLMAIWAAQALASRMMGKPDDQPATKPDRKQQTSKPTALDPDAYDVVGSRG